ncbi:MAG TPA: hypothetical protein VI895_06450 [Bdellovibrionota bacterium]|nr:hypothetical protein [Bdellovibrionota bacterium]
MKPQKKFNLVLIGGLFWAGTGSAVAQENAVVTEDTFAAEVVQTLPFENDPSVDLKREFDLLLHLLHQRNSFMLLPTSFSKRLQGNTKEDSGPGRQKGTVKATDGATSLVFHVPVSAKGPYEMKGTHSGQAQYWTIQGEPTFFVEGADDSKPIRIEGSAAAGGLKRFTISLPEGARLGPIAMQTSSGRSMLPPEGLERGRVLTERTMLEVFARILGKLGRLPKKSGVQPLAVRAATPQARLSIAPHTYRFDVPRAGCYAFHLEGRGSLFKPKLDGQEIGSLVPGAPAPEGEEGGKAVFLTLEAGEHEFNIPAGSAEEPTLIIEELEEGRDAYKKLMADIGFEAENLETPVTQGRLRRALVILGSLLRPRVASEDRIWILSEEEQAKQMEAYRSYWSVHFPSVRPPVSPVLPQGN